MRTTFLLMGGLTLVLGACSSKKSAPPPPLPNKELLTGKWNNSSEIQFLAGYEFDEDGVVKVTFRGLKDPIPGRYTWTGERTMELEYSKEADDQKAYEAAAKSYKGEIEDRIQKKKLDGKAGSSIRGMVNDKLPLKETFTVGISDPKLLILVRKGGVSLTFNKVD
jgi:hypothetical protein